jgi:hypothetical protein
MLNQNVFQRYEKKFILTIHQFNGLIKSIEKQMVLDPYCLGGQRYHLRNVYFDTVDHQLISNSLLKPDFKEKLRIRKYGRQGDGTSLVFLEVKRKVKGIVTKRRASMSLDEIDAFMEQKIIPARTTYYDQQILNELNYMTRIYDLKKAVFIEYDRLAFFDKEDPEFRVTFDENILTRYQDYDFESVTSGVSLLMPGQILMEVKVGEAMPLWFAKALSKHKVYLGSFSKYGKAYEFEIAKEIFNDV